MQEKYCHGCMEIMEEESVCRICGYETNTPPKESFHLFPGTILKGRYLIGKSLGNGGFGVTYIGRDLILGGKVAIKEYLPSEFSTRAPNQQTLSIYTGEAALQFEAGLKGFDEEAKRLAKLSDIPGVVKIYDVFHENKTSYIVMEYLEGETVADKLKRCKKLPYKEVEDIMTVVLSTLDEVHATGIIHRDVSPGNIFITNDGNVKLIDFGAARFASAYHTKSLSIILKPGYAPEEQYRSKGNQGPWTDVYSAAATMYKMLTGKTPQESVERMVKDELLPLGKLGVSIDKNKENAIMNALNVDSGARTRSAARFLGELFANEKVTRRKETSKKTDEGKLPLWAKIFVAIIPLVIIGAAFLLFNHGTAGANDNYTTVPNIISKNEDDAKNILSEKGLDMVVAGTVDVEFGKSGLVQKVVPRVGTYLKKGETIEVFLSKNSSVIMPNLLYWNVDEAAEKMENAGLNTKIEYVETNDFADNVIIEQEYSEGEVLPQNSLIKIKAAKRTEEQNPSDEIPGIAGMNIEEAAATLMESGYGLVVKEEKFDDSPVGTVLEQKNPESGEDAVVEVTASLGEKYAYMKDFSLSSKEEVEGFFKDTGIKINYEYIGTFDYAQDMVLEQNPSAGEKLFEGDEITISLSFRSDVSFRVGETITFGTYQQKTNPNAGKDPIEWQVLDVKDGKALVISKYVIEARKVFDNDLGYGRPKWKWETSDFRKWLNKDFINEAFSAEEQDSIIKSTIKNPANPKSGKGGGNNTSDKVFLLSCEEVEKYFPTEKDREAEAVRKVADLLGLYYPHIGYNDEWCTRTAGEDAYGPVHIISSSGLMDYAREGSWDDATGLRPAMWIDVYSFSEPESVSSGVKVGDIVTFGSYEQDNDFGNGKEPIKWKVLKVENGRAMLITNSIIDAVKVEDNKGVPFGFSQKTETWLNGKFLNESFTSEEAKHILKIKTDYSYGKRSGTVNAKIRFLTTTEFVELEKETADLGGKSEYVKRNYVFSDVYTNTPWCLIGGVVGGSGKEREIQQSTFGDYFGIHPVMWIDISGEEKVLEANEPEVIDTTPKVGNTIKFGSYEQDNNLENGAEPIEWTVLEKKDGRLMLISKYVLDAKQTSGGEYGLSVLPWLNGTFYNDAFAEDEKDSIVVVEKSYDYKNFQISGKGTVNEKVRVLTDSEFSKYSKSSIATEYVKSRYTFEGYSRIPYYLIGGVARGSQLGLALKEGDYIGIRPLIWIEY